MSVTDRLDEIEGRAGSQVLIKILSAPDGVTISDADYARRTDDTFALVAALRAALAVEPGTRGPGAVSMRFFRDAIRAAITEALDGSA